MSLKQKENVNNNEQSGVICGRISPHKVHVDQNWRLQYTGSGIHVVTETYKRVQLHTRWTKNLTNFST